MMTSNGRRSRRAPGGPLQSTELWTVSLVTVIALAIGAAAVTLSTQRTCDPPDGYTRVKLRIQRFQQELEIVAVEDPPDAEHLKAALARIGNETDRWRGCSIEPAVLTLKARITEKLATMNGGK